MDVGGTIQKILEVESQRVTKAQDVITKQNERIGAWLDVKGKLSDLTKASNTLRFLDVWRKMAPTSSVPETATATAASNAVKARYNVEVIQLARAQTVGSSSGLTTGGADPQAVTSSTKLVDIDGINAGNQFAIAGQSFTITADDTLATLRTKINEAAVNMPASERVNATILDNRLVLQRVQSGADNVILSDISGSPLQQLGILNAVGEPSNVLLSAQNAVFTINGAYIERTSNTGLTDVIDGVTLNLNNTGTTEINIASDTEAVKDAIRNFVDAYNVAAENNEFFGNLDTTDPSNPVPGPLQGDFMMREIITTLRRQVTQMMSATHTAANSSYSIDGQQGVMNALHHIGVWTTGQSNRLEIVDEGRLDAMLNEFPEQVENLFRGIQQPNGTRAAGIGQLLYNTSRNYTSDLDGYIDYRVEQIDDEIKLQDARIDRMMRDMEMKEQRLWAQFGAMDEAIGKMNKDLDWLLNSLNLKS